MHKNRTSVITPPSLVQFIKRLKTFVVSREETIRPRLVNYLPGRGEDWT
ncbi:MAG: hypothetical protein ACN4GW_08310 [Desulforhopalus sp.]